MTLPQVSPGQPPDGLTLPQFQSHQPVVQQFVEEQPPRFQNNLLVIANTAGAIANGLIALTILILIVLGVIGSL